MQRGLWLTLSRVGGKGAPAVWTQQPWIAQCMALDVSSWVQQTSDHKESPFSFALAWSLVLYFAIEPTYNVWVGGRLLDSPCVLEK